MNDRETVIEVTELVTHYGDRRVLDGVNLTVKRGEIMVVMGGSGSGKSTLMRHLLGLIKPTSGTVQMLGTDVTRAKKRQLYELRRQIGVAFQGGAMLSSLTVGENVQLPLREHTKLDDKTIGIMTRLKLELMNMAGTENLMPSELSGGMLKRAALARAVVMDPKMLFFDEPSAGLDPVVAVELDELILSLREAIGITIVIVTHELESAFKIADRITILHQGRVAVTDTVEAVRTSENEHVQDLLQRRPRRDAVDAEAYLNRLTDGHF